MTGLGEGTAKSVEAVKAGLGWLSAGICEEVDWTKGLHGMARVNVHGGRQWLPMLIQPPHIGDSVWVVQVGPQALCLGPVAKAQLGNISGSAADGLIAVDADDGETYSLPYVGDAPAANDRVAIDWQPGGLVVGKASADPVTHQVYSPPSQSSGASLHKSLFYPTDSGTYQSSWFIPQVWCSDSDIGCFFYETQTRDSIPAAASVQSVRLYLDEYYGFGDAPTIGVHDMASKSGAPSVFGAVTITGGSGWKSLPTIFGDSLKSGGNALGIGTDHGGYHKYSSAGVNGSGTLEIVWIG